MLITHWCLYFVKQHHTEPRLFSLKSHVAGDRIRTADMKWSKGYSLSHDIITERVTKGMGVHFSLLMLLGRLAEYLSVGSEQLLMYHLVYTCIYTERESKLSSFSFSLSKLLYLNIRVRHCFPPSSPLLSPIPLKRRAASLRSQGALPPATLNNNTLLNTYSFALLHA